MFIFQTSTNAKYPIKTGNGLLKVTLNLQIHKIIITVTLIHVLPPPVVIGWELCSSNVTKTMIA